jgi:AbrB family looped-hinge helix DNA binding protein
MRAATRLTSKGQVVIPKPVRERLGWRSGVRLRVETRPAGGVTLSPAADDDPIEAAFGLLAEGDPLAALEAEHRAEVEADERRRRR